MSTRPDAPTLWLALMRAYRAMDKVAGESIRHAGMCYTDFAILESLLHRGPLAVNAITTDIHLTSGSMTSAVDRLVNRGLVARAENPADKRGRIVRLTDAGLALIETAYLGHVADLREVVDGALRTEERAVLFDLLRKLEHGARQDSD